MGEANNESRRRMSGGGMEHLFGKYPNQRDLLQRFMAASSNNMNHNTHAGQSGYVKQEQQEEEEQEEEEEEEEEEGIELNLGLSLGGRFGIDKNAGSRKKLIRSTSVASSIPLIRDEYDAAMNPAVPVAAYHPTLIRTSSLPTETEEEWRKRKEMQTLRRMEAKRRRSEKQKNNNSNPRTDKDGVGSGIVAGGAGAGGEEERREIERENSIGFKQYMMAAAAAAAAATAAASPGSGSNRVGASPPIGLPGWAAAAAARQGLLGGGSDTAAAAGSKGKSSLLGGLQGFGQPNLQGSVESQGGGSSSGMSEPVQGSSSGGEVRSPGSTHSLQELNNQDTIGTSGKNANENTQKTAGTDEAKPSTKRPESTTESRGKETGMSAMEDMPCVFTKGDGPNGQRIDGILYKYGKGEEVRIMCVCHGWFLSPAAFVKHAGGGDVDNPLRHIVVNRSANSFL